MARGMGCCGYTQCFAALVVFALATVMTVVNQWSRSLNYTVIQETTRPLIVIGLWKICSGNQNSARSMTNANCASIGPMSVPANVVPSFVHCVRAFMIIAVISAFTSLVFAILGADCSVYFQGKSRRTINFVASGFLLFSAVLVTVSVTWWGVKTMSNNSINWYSSATGMNNFRSVNGQSYTIGTCVILGWVFGPIAIIYTGFSFFCASRITEEDLHEYATQYQYPILESNHPMASGYHERLTQGMSAQHSYRPPPTARSQGYYIPPNQRPSTNHGGSTAKFNPYPDGDRTWC